jgi:hypothetical protein
MRCRISAFTLLAAMSLAAQPAGEQKKNLARTLARAYQGKRVDVLVSGLVAGPVTRDVSPPWSDSLVWHHYEQSPPARLKRTIRVDDQTVLSGTLSAATVPVPQGKGLRVEDVRLECRNQGSCAVTLFLSTYDPGTPVAPGALADSQDARLKQADTLADTPVAPATLEHMPHDAASYKGGDFPEIRYNPRDQMRQSCRGCDLVASPHWQHFGTGFRFIFHFDQNRLFATGQAEASVERVIGRYLACR